MVPSHLFVKPPSDQHPAKAERHYEADDGDVSDNDTPGLPVLQRRSVESRHHWLCFLLVIIIYLQSPSDIYEHDSDHDGQDLHVCPRHTAVPPTPPTPGFPRPAPRRSVPSAPENEESFSPSCEMPVVAVSEPEPGEVLDDEEGGKCLFFPCTELLLIANEQIPLIRHSIAQADELLRRICALQHKMIHQGKYHRPSAGPTCQS